MIMVNKMHIKSQTYYLTPMGVPMPALRVPMPPIGVPMPRGFSGYCLKDAVKGPQLEKKQTQLFLSHTFLEESQNGS